MGYFSSGSSVGAAVKAKGGSRAPGRPKAIRSFAELRALWREDRAANGGRFSVPGFQALAVYRFGVWAHGLEGPISRRVFQRLYAATNWFSRSFHGIELPRHARIGRRLHIGHQGGIVVHGSAVIGDDCVIRHNVTIGADRHRSTTSVPRLGNRVEIGSGAALIGEIEVGDDALIGANVVVRRDVPAGGVVLPPEPTITIRRSFRSPSAGLLAACACSFAALDAV